MHKHSARLLALLTAWLLFGALRIPCLAAAPTVASPPTADMTVIYAVAALLIVAIVILIFREPRSK